MKKKQIFSNPVPCAPIFPVPCPSMVASSFSVCQRTHQYKSRNKKLHTIEMDRPELAQNKTMAWKKVDSNCNIDTSVQTCKSPY